MKGITYIYISKITFLSDIIIVFLYPKLCQEPPGSQRCVKSLRSLCKQSPDRSRWWMMCCSKNTGNKKVLIVHLLE